MILFMICVCLGDGSGAPSVGGLTLEGSVPLASMPDDPAPEVAVLPMREWVRRKSKCNEYKIRRINIWGQTEVQTPLLRV